MISKIELLPSIKFIAFPSRFFRGYMDKRDFLSKIVFLSIKV